MQVNQVFIFYFFIFYGLIGTPHLIKEEIFPFFLVLYITLIALIYVNIQATLALYAVRRTSGIVVNIGFQVTSVVPSKLFCFFVWFCSMLALLIYSFFLCQSLIALIIVLFCLTFLHFLLFYLVVLNGKVMRQVGVEFIGLGALKLTGYLRLLLQQSGIKFESLYTVGTLKEVLIYLHVLHYHIMRHLSFQVGKCYLTFWNCRNYVMSLLIMKLSYQKILKHH